MLFLGAFVLGAATVICCYELAWWLAERHAERIKATAMRPSALPPIYFDAGPTRLESMRAMERES